MKNMDVFTETNTFRYSLQNDIDSNNSNSENIKEGIIAKQCFFTDYAPKVFDNLRKQLKKYLIS